MRRTSSRRSGESGFALLLVFAMAATVMVMLYLEMPRVAFEYQRSKEGLLVERGEQFMRAIALYHRKFAKLPQNIDELESTNNLRFLRRKYIDPMTGKDEWRLVHVDAAGQYVDSLVHKRQGQEEKKGPSALAATIQGIGSQAEYTPGLGGEQEKNPALQKRASDRIIPGGPGGSGQTAGESGDAEQPAEGRSGSAGASNSPFEGVPGSGNAPTDQPQGAVPGIPGQPGNRAPGAPGQGTGAQGTGASGQAGNSGAQAGNAGAGQPGQPSGGGFGFGGSGGFGSGTGSTNAPQSGNSPAGQQQNSPFGNSNPFLQGQGQPGQGQPGQRPAPVQDNTLRAIGNIISGQQQRPGSATGGAAGSGGLGGSLPGAGGTGGVVGVASKADFTGILVYNEKTNVKEWEFLYDMKKAAQAAAGQQGNPQGQNPAQGNQNQQRPSMSNPFGNTQGGRTGRP